MSAPRNPKDPLRWIAVAALAAVAGWLLWRMQPMPDARHPARHPPAAREALPATSPVGAAETTPAPGAPIAESVRDRAVRDDVRRRIWSAWNARGPATAPAGADPLRAPIPARDEPLDTDYLRARIREDFIPMAQTCYESFLTRRPGVGGRVVMDFTLVGEAGVGGVVDEAEVHGPAEDGGAARDDVWDPGFLTCLRESMLTVAFRAPPQSGRLRVRYPITLAPDAPDAGPRDR